MKYLAFQIILATALLACQVEEEVTPSPDIDTTHQTTGDTDPVADTDTTEDTDTADSDTTDTDATDGSCPGDFPSGEGPGCCLVADNGDAPIDRAECNGGQWECLQGVFCTCAAAPMGYECLDDCAFTMVDLPWCIFGDHYECFPPTEVDASTCP